MRAHKARACMHACIRTHPRAPCTHPRVQVSDAGIEGLASSCTSLRDLNLFNCSLVGDRGLSALVSRCEHPLQTIEGHV
jgi:hypothetical protein